MPRTRLDGERSFKKPHGELRDGKQRPIYDRIYIDPQQNVIIGSRNIARYIGVTSINTLYEWTELYAFPMIKRPDGLLMTTMTAIDQWIFIAAALIEEHKAETGHTMVKGLRAAAKRAAAGTGAIEPSDYRKKTGNLNRQPVENPGMYERDQWRKCALCNKAIPPHDEELLGALAFHKRRGCANEFLQAAEQSEVLYSNSEALNSENSHSETIEDSNAQA